MLLQIFVDKTVLARDCTQVHHHKDWNCTWLVFELLHKNNFQPLQIARALNTIILMHYCCVCPMDHASMLLYNNLPENKSHDDIVQGAVPQDINLHSLQYLSDQG